MVAGASTEACGGFDTPPSAEVMGARFDGDKQLETALRDECKRAGF